ncbi:MAG: hypothetical protein LRZ88_10420 [Candidatus Cloacimonetes bacterium]|nr:hypothetical protein [Candidatus Cloacimonadota bacterium]
MLFLAAWAEQYADYSAQLHNVYLSRGLPLPELEEVRINGNRAFTAG